MYDFGNTEKNLKKQAVFIRKPLAFSIKTW